MKKPAPGFSRVELLIVVAIILIIAAIANRNPLRSRIVANQASVVGSPRLINTAETTYSSTSNTGFSPDLASLGPGASGTFTASAAGLIDSVLASGVKSGYRFFYSATSTADRYDAYHLNANPTILDSTELNDYFTDQSGVVRQHTIGTASVADSALAG